MSSSAISSFFSIICKSAKYKNEYSSSKFIKEALESDVFYVETADHSSPSYNFDDIEAEESLRGEFLRELRALSVSEEEFIRCGKEDI